MSGSSAVPPYQIYSTTPPPPPPPPQARASVADLLFSAVTPIMQNAMEQLQNAGIGAAEDAQLLDQFDQLHNTLLLLGDPAPLPSNYAATLQSEISALQQSIEALPTTGSVGVVRGQLLSDLAQVNAIFTTSPFFNLCDSIATNAMGVYNVLYAVETTPQNQFQKEQNQEANAFSKYYGALSQDQVQLNDLITQMKSQGVTPPPPLLDLQTTLNNSMDDLNNIQLWDYNRMPDHYSLGSVMAAPGNWPGHSMDGNVAYFLNDLNRACQGYDSPNYAESGISQALSDFQLTPPGALQAAVTTAEGSSDVLSPQETVELIHQLENGGQLTPDQQLDYGALTSVYQNALNGVTEAIGTLQGLASENLMIEATTELNILKAALYCTQYEVKQQLDVQVDLIQQLRKIAGK